MSGVRNHLGGSQVLLSQRGAGVPSPLQDEIKTMEFVLTFPFSLPSILTKLVDDVLSTKDCVMVN